MRKYLSQLSGIHFSSFRYNAKVHSHVSKLKSLLFGLDNVLLTKPEIVVVTTGLLGTERAGWENDWIDYDTFIRQGQDTCFGRSEDGKINWHRGSFNDPLWILFSSGTTGVYFLSFYFYFYCLALGIRCIECLSFV